MDNLFPHEPLQDTSISNELPLSNDRASEVKPANRAAFSEPTAKLTSAPSAEDDAALISRQQSLSADLNQTDGSNSKGAALIQSGAPATVLPRAVPPTLNETAPNISIPRDAVKPSNPSRDMVAVDDSKSTELSLQSSEPREETKPLFEELATEPLMPSLAGLHLKPVGLTTADPAITKPSETEKSAAAPNQLVDISPDVPRPLAPSHLGQIPDEYPEDTKEELSRISANITAARPKSEPARQVFASRTRIRSLLELDHTVKEIYNHLVEDKRVSADKVSFKQFERQVDTLNLRSKPAKTPSPIRSTDRS